MVVTDLDICVIEDDESQLKLLLHQLAADNLRALGAGNGADGLQIVARQRPRIVLADIGLPDIDGIEICRRLRAEPALDGLYFIAISARTDSECKQALLEAGADDFLIKPFDWTDLRARIRSGMRLCRMYDRLQRAAQIDGLTELWNHTYFRAQLDSECARVRRYGGDVAMILGDIDHFKSINDTYGHEVGNDVLQQCGRTLRTWVRETDVVARYGGEEFAIICPNTSLDDATYLADRLRRAIEEEVRLAKRPELVVRMSLGVADMQCGNVHTSADLINICDQAMYESKRNGRNRVTRCDADHGNRTLVMPPGNREVDRLRRDVATLSLHSKETCIQSMLVLVQALELRDPYSAEHSRDVARFVRRLAEALNWPEYLREVVYNAGLLHDLGTMAISDAILHKTDRLSEAEWTRLREAPQITAQILEPLRLFEAEIAEIQALRENFDGSGAPHNLVGEEIPVGSRLLAVAEGFSALTCDRAYRRKHSIEDALELIRQDANRKFDPRFVELLVKCVEADPQFWRPSPSQPAAVKSPPVPAAV